jgi:hypothetical protein
MEVELNEQRLPTTAGLSQPALVERMGYIAYREFFVPFVDNFVGRIDLNYLT